MTTEIHLTKEDIQKILAEKFNVNPDAVKVETYKEWVGYGMGEHEEHNVKAVITTLSNL